MQVIIMRGLPGSGKSSWLSQSFPQARVCSADHYHMIDGVYRFDPSKALAAHNACLRKFLSELLDPSTPSDNGVVAVDNTNSTAWEIAPYYRLAEMSGFSVKIVRMVCSFKTACLRNQHGVPQQNILRMLNYLDNEILPPWWKEEFVFTE